VAKPKVGIVDTHVEMAYIVIFFTISMKLINIAFAGGVLRMLVFSLFPVPVSWLIALQSEIGVRFHQDL
jgi:hypothetical protein